MPDPIIRVEGISKKYNRGVISASSFRQDLQHWWTTSVLKKQDPFFKGHSNEHSLNNSFLALDNIHFELEEGEVLGIIGSNGAGKSTLLKIVSRIIKPTTGFILGKGKISSILEIGTGFHHELTGRENIYLSGYILGMSKGAVRKNFDEIVDFAGIEPFIDTPVKRYSSGMYVRLAFAVAAFLDPDILVVDEVLAVGDAEFQKKCLRKMHDVTTQKGRTILFVSHNMQAVKQLCQKALYLEEGKQKAIGEVHQVVNKYLSGIQRSKLELSFDDCFQAPGTEYIRVNSMRLVPLLNNPSDPIDIRVPFKFTVRFWSMFDDAELSVGVHLFSISGECIFDIASPSIRVTPGLVEAECHIPGDFLNDGTYYISVIFVKDTSVNLFYFEECLFFDVEDYRAINWYGKWMGAVRPKFPFTIKQIEYE